MAHPNDGITTVEYTAAPQPSAYSTYTAKDVYFINPKDISLHGKVAGVPAKLLVDTFASTIVINAAFYWKLPSVYKLETASVPAINTVSGQRLPIIGQAIFPLDVSGKSYRIRMYVIKDLGFEAVLGRDFLAEEGAVINFHDRTV